jgi:hypothetical protein
MVPVTSQVFTLEKVKMQNLKWAFYISLIRSTSHHVIFGQIATIMKDPETYCTASLQISPMSFPAAMHTSLVLCINKNGYISTGVIRF